jgi:NAD(P)-dependent dehydrogenase (short-subunit alcohol dehydrogenase family)
MNVAGKVVVVTGAGGGIGRALAVRLARAGARGVAIGDIDGRAADAVAREVGGVACATDVGVESDVQRLVARAVEAFGPVDVFCSNAGIFVAGGEEVLDADWQRIHQVNVMSHVYAARAALPAMLARREGAFVITASAAGLLSQVGSAPYAVTKHAAVAFAEWLSITYGDRGLRVACLCPQGVRTAMLDDQDTPAFLREGAITPEAVADAVVEGLAGERFLVLPHPEVATYLQRKTSDYDRWLRGMRRLDAKARGSA